MIMGAAARGARTMLLDADLDFFFAAMHSSVDRDRPARQGIGARSIVLEPPRRGRRPC